MQNIQVNHLVTVDNEYGIGKVVNIFDEKVDVRFFINIKNQVVKTYDMSQVSIVYLSPKTRVYIHDPETKRWQMGRVKKYDQTINPVMDYLIHFPNKKDEWYGSEDLEVRCLQPLEDPTEVLAYYGGESQFLHDIRSKSLQKLVEMKASSYGMTALTSSSIDFIPYQVEIVQRILSDNTQRYLLADEVGMGKTIEAGIVARQTLLDNGESEILIVVPEHLKGKWYDEMYYRFGLLEHVSIVSPSEVENRDYTLMIVDEAHHLIKGNNVNSSILKEIALKSKNLLLLSATPGIGQENVLFDMLKLLDPVLYQNETFENFKLKLEKQSEIGRFLRNLRPNQAKFVLKRTLNSANTLFSDDSYVLNMVEKILNKIITDESYEKLILNLKHYLLENYRLHQRLIRTRRRDADEWVFGRRGPENIDDFSHITSVFLENKMLEEVYDLVEKWREEVSLFDNSDDMVNTYVNLLKTPFLEKSNAYTLVTDLYTKSENENISEILIELQQKIEKNDFLYIDEIAENIIQYVSDSHGWGNKYIVFISDKEISLKLEKALNSLEENIAVAYQEDKKLSISTHFENNSRAPICICNQNMEEGVDFQYAKALIHIDLPLDPSRIEQRIGRLDRYGRTHRTVDQLIIFPTSDQDSLWYAWFELLKYGFKLFHIPISDIQLSMERIKDDLLQNLFKYGVVGFVNAFTQEGDSEGLLIDKLEEIIAKEREKLDEQYALNHLIMEEENRGNLAQEMEDAEYPESEIAEIFNNLFFRFLNFSKQTIEKDRFRIKWDERRALIPRQQFWSIDGSVVTPLWEGVFQGALNGELTYKRNTAVKNAQTSLLRPGHPLFSALDKFWKWEDRGSVFVTWRTEENFPEFIPRDNVWIAFKLDFIVEVEESESNSALNRRCDAYIPAQYFTIFLDQDMNAIEDKEITEILSRPYDKKRGDRNLSSRKYVLDHFIDHEVLQQMCTNVHLKAKEKLFENDEFHNMYENAKRNARKEINKRIESIKIRQKLLNGDISYDENELILFEEKISRQLDKLSIRLDSIGLFFVSRWSIQDTRLFNEYI